MRINTNVSSLNSRRWISRTYTKLDRNLRRLSRKLITRASDDAAGLAISENLKSHARSQRQAKKKANDAISLIQTAEGGLREVSPIIVKLKKLAMQASSDTMSPGERGPVNIEFQKLKREIDQFSQSLEFNGMKLLNGQSGILSFQIGLYNDHELDRLHYDSSLINTTTKFLGLCDESVAERDKAQSSLHKFDEALAKINGMRATLQNIQNRLSSSVQAHLISEENMSAVNSRIRDVNSASETAILAKNKILIELGSSVLGPANQTPKAMLKRIG